MIRELGSFAGSIFLSASQLTCTLFPSPTFLIHAQSGVAPSPWTATMLKKAKWLVYESTNETLSFMTYSTHGFDPSKTTFNPSTAGHSAIFLRCSSMCPKLVDYSTSEAVVNRTSRSSKCGLSSVGRSLSKYCYANSPIQKRRMVIEWRSARDTEGPRILVADSVKSSNCRYEVVLGNYSDGGASWWGFVALAITPEHSPNDAITAGTRP